MQALNLFHLFLSFPLPFLVFSYALPHLPSRAKQASFISGGCNVDRGNGGRHKCGRLPVVLLSSNDVGAGYNDRKNDVSLDHVSKKDKSLIARDTHDSRSQLDAEFRRDPRDIHSRKKVDVEAVEELLRVREKAKKRSDFDLADELRDELLRDFGVHIIESQRLWTTDSKPKERSAAEYRRAPDDPIDDTDTDPEAVEELLKVREKALRKNDFDLADELLDELKRDHGVYVVDSSRTWTTASKTSQS